MAKINDLLKAFKTDIQALVNKDSSAEDIEANSKLLAKIDEVEAEANKTIEDKQIITDKYLEAVRGVGSTEKPKDEPEANKPRSLEEITAEVLAQDKK